MAAVTHAEAHASDHADHGDGLYWKVFAGLFVLTAIEVSTEWWPEDMSAITATVLIILMTIKFLIVAFYFMHLKGDASILKGVFFCGAIGIVALMAGVFGAMRFFESSGMDPNDAFGFNDPPYERPMPPPPTDPPPIIRETGGSH